MNIISDQLLEHQDFIKFSRDSLHEADFKAHPVKLHNFIINFPDSGVVQFEPENPGSRDIIISSAIEIDCL